MLTPIGIPQILHHRLVIHNHRQRGLGAISDDAVPLGLAVHFDGLAHLGIQFARVRRDHGFKLVSGLVDPGMGSLKSGSIFLKSAPSMDPEPDGHHGPADWPGIAGLPDLSLCPVPLRAPAAVIDGDATLPFPVEISIDREHSRTSLSYPGSRLSPGPTYARVNLIVQIYAYFSAYPHLLPLRGHYFVQELSIFEQN